MEYSEQKLGSYLKELGSACPSPGGGSAAALSAALGMSLVCMVMGINDKREKNPKQMRMAKQRQRTAFKLQKAFIAFVTKDTKVFTEFTKLKKKTGQSNQSALKKCARIPFQVCQECLEALTICQREKNRTSAWLISDLYEAAILLEAAFRSARLNVEINLKSILDSSWVAKTRMDLDELDSKIKQITRKVLTGCEIG